MSFLHSGTSSDNECHDQVLNRLFSLMARKFKVRDVYLSLPGVPTQELIAMGLTPSPKKEALVEALVFMHAYSRVIIVKDALADPLLKSHPVTTSEVPCLRFVAAASVMMDNNKVGNLCLLDFVPHEQFSTEEQGLLLEFADTIAGIWTDRQQLYHDLRRDGIHMQQSVLGIMRPPLMRLVHESDTVDSTLKQLEILWQGAQFNQLDKTITGMVKDVSYFEYLVSTAIRVVSLAQIHDGMYNKASASKAETNLQYLYDLKREEWRESLRELIYHFGLLSVWVYSDEKLDLEDCKLTAHPHVLHFCIAALLGHLYCSNCQQNIYITTSITQTQSAYASTPTLHKAIAFNAKLAAKEGKSESTISNNINRFVSKNARKLCIQISTQENLLPLPKEVKESLDILSKQYLHGQLRQVTNHCFQILLPVMVDDVEVMSAEETAVPITHASMMSALEAPHDAQPSSKAINSAGDKQETYYRHFTQQQQLQILRQKKALFPDLTQNQKYDNESSLSFKPSMRRGVSLVAEEALENEYSYGYFPDGKTTETVVLQDSSVLQASNFPNSNNNSPPQESRKLFTSGMSGILSLTSYRNVAQTLVDSCRSLLHLNNHNALSIAPAPSTTTTTAGAAAAGATGAAAAEPVPSTAQIHTHPTHTNANISNAHVVKSSIRSVLESNASSTPRSTATTHDYHHQQQHPYNAHHMSGRSNLSASTINSREAVQAVASKGYVSFARKPVAALWSSSSPVAASPVSVTTTTTTTKTNHHQKDAAEKDVYHSLHVAPSSSSSAATTPAAAAAAATATAAAGTAKLTSKTSRTVVPSEGIAASGNNVHPLMASRKVSPMVPDELVQ